MKIGWRVEFLDDEVMSALNEFPRDIRGKFARIVTLIETHGVEQMREPYVKHPESPVWEMRMKGRDGIARAAYVTATGRRVVVGMSSPRRCRRRHAGISNWP